jgi:triphosphatase
MAKEIELKLSVCKHHVESLKKHPLLQSGSVTDLGAKTLKNIYFDTPEHALSGEKVALRIREKGGRYIQTLKTSGSADGGLHARHEWEWEIDEPELDFALLRKAQWPQALNTADVLDRIEPVFATDFVRHAWLYEGEDAQGQALRIELALDQGQAWVDQHGERRHDPICELELELLEGDPTGLFSVALQLAAQVPLLSSDISKAQRGYRLSRPDLYPVDPERLPLPLAATLEELFCLLLVRELGLWPQYLEAWRFKREWRHVTEALESLRNMGAIYESFADIIPLDPDGELDQLLTKLIRQLRDVDAWHRAAGLTEGQAADWQMLARQRAEARVDVLLQTLGFGQIALRIGQQIVSRSWRKRWSEAQREQAQAVIEMH